jgi:hypothetical protein
MQVICIKSFKGVLTEGKTYDVIRKDGENIVVVDDKGDEVGFMSHRFSDLKGNPLSKPQVVVIKNPVVDINPLDIVERKGEFFDYEETKKLVSKLFKDKMDIGGQPYYYHLRAVSDFCKCYGEDVQTVGLLHDILEDIPTVSVKHLIERYPKDIADAVCILTKKSGISYEKYIEEVSQNPIALRVKIADLKHNMDITRLPSLGNNSINRLRKYHQAYVKLVSLL